jgi:glycogen(starch) synthase
LGVESAVEFTGWLPLDQVESQLADAWALVAPSRWAEPLGLTALEAVVRGLPAVVSRIGGLSETVEEGVSGLLFPNGDVAALAQCLSDISSGRVFSGGVSPAVAGAIQARHDLGAHVTWIRDLLLEIAA